jgi:hypothetical protein
MEQKKNKGYPISRIFVHKENQNSIKKVSFKKPHTKRLKEEKNE